MRPHKTTRLHPAGEGGSYRTQTARVLQWHKRHVQGQLLVLVKRRAPGPDFCSSVPPSCLSPRASPSLRQLDRQNAPACLRSTGKTKSLTLKHFETSPGYIQKRQRRLTQRPLSEHGSDAAGETITYPANCVMLYTGIGIAF